MSFNYRALAGPSSSDEHIQLRVEAPIKPVEHATFYTQGFNPHERISPG
jgi:hypothetical protein